jgi:hypothetical protein
MSPAMHSDPAWYKKGLWLVEEMMLVQEYDKNLKQSLDLQSYRQESTIGNVACASLYSRRNKHDIQE